MKRTWKNFKIDPNKVYAFIGRAVSYSAGFILVEMFGIWAFLQGLTY